MISWWILLVIATLVAIAVWVLSAERERRKHSATLLAFEAKCLWLENQTAELRTEVRQREQEIQQTQAELRQQRDAYVKAEATLQETLKRLEQSEKLLEQAKDFFANLRTPSVKGRWGELTLRRVVELAGLSEQCDFNVQVTTDSSDSRGRPDMIVHLPAQREVIVDAKTPLDAFQEAMQASSEEARLQAMSRHARAIRNHMDDLSSKAYWSQFPQAPEFVVLFLPGESFFSGALECDRALVEDGIARRVVLATPTTLIALLWAVAYGWRWEAVAKNTETISQLGAQVYERMGVLTEHLSNIGSTLGKAVESFNRAVGSLETRLLPSVRKFRELGATAAEEIPTLEPVDQTPRTLPEE